MVLFCLKVLHQLKLTSLKSYQLLETQVPFGSDYTRIVTLPVESLPKHVFSHLYLFISFPYLFISGFIFCCKLFFVCYVCFLFVCVERNYLYYSFFLYFVPVNIVNLLFLPMRLLMMFLLLIMVQKFLPLVTSFCLCYTNLYCMDFFLP